MKKSVEENCLNGGGNGFAGDAGAGRTCVREIQGKKSDLAFELRNADLVNGNTITVPERPDGRESNFSYKGTPVKFRLKMKNSRRLGMRRPDESWSKKVTVYQADQAE